MGVENILSEIKAALLGGGSVAPAPAIAPVTSVATESNHVLKTGAGALLDVSCVIGAVSGYLMVFDATVAPADGAVTPMWFWPVTSDGTNGALNKHFDSPLKFTTGCVVVFSSTGPLNKTASATAQFIGQVQ